VLKTVQQGYIDKLDATGTDEFRKQLKPKVILFPPKPKQFGSSKVKGALGTVDNTSFWAFLAAKFTDPEGNTIWLTPGQRIDPGRDGHAVVIGTC
jgi:hypothetical protein